MDRVLQRTFCDVPLSIQIDATTIYLPHRFRPCLIRSNIKWCIKIGNLSMHFSASGSYFHSYHVFTIWYDTNPLRHLIWITHSVSLRQHATIVNNIMRLYQVLYFVLCCDSIFTHILQGCFQWYRSNNAIAWLSQYLQFDPEWYRKNTYMNPHKKLSIYQNKKCETKLPAYSTVNIVDIFGQTLSKTMVSWLLINY